MTWRDPSPRTVFFLLLLTYLNFAQAATWGSACRFDLSRALVERGTVSIDSYHENTGDKAFFEGRYYSDKAPLPSYLGAIGVAAGHGVRGVTGHPKSHAIWLAMTAALATFAATGIPTALGGALFFDVLRERGVGPANAWWTTFFVFFGTTLFPYGTLLQGHAPAAAWLLGFFAALFPGRGTPTKRRMLLAGFAASGALATEYLTGPAIGILAFVAVVKHRALGRRLLPLVGWAILGALPGLVLLGSYHALAFGNPFDIGYRHVALPFFQEKMSAGFLGVGPPDLAVAGKLLFGSYRGLFFTCPVLAFAVWGWIEWCRDRERRLEAIAAFGVFAFYLVLNAGYSSWHGGWAIGPRHLVPAIPLLGLGIAPLLPRARIVAGVGVYSVALMLAVTVVQPEVPEDIRHPVHAHALPHFLRAEYSIAEQGFDDLLPARKDPQQPDRWDAFLLGEALRLPGPLALLPILLSWVVFLPRVRRHADSLAAGAREL